MTSSAERAEVWAERIERWKASGLKQQPFCEREGIPYYGFRRWRRRLEGGTRRGRTPSTLVPLEIAALGASKPSVVSAMEVCLNGNRRIVVGAQFDEVALNRLIRLLERLAC